MLALNANAWFRESLEALYSFITWFTIPCKYIPRLYLLHLQPGLEPMAVKMCEAPKTAASSPPWIKSRTILVSSLHRKRTLDNRSLIISMLVLVFCLRVRLCCFWFSKILSFAYSAEMLSRCCSIWEISSSTCPFLTAHSFSSSPI